MLTSIESGRRPFNPAQRGYHALYRENAVNHCPGCGRTHWIIGRVLAECGFCATALPLSETYARGWGTMQRRSAGGDGFHASAA